MPFNSFSFAILAVVTICLYYLPVLRRFQILILIAASFVFYALDHTYLLKPLVGTIAVNIAASYLVCYGNPRLRKLFAFAGVALNLAVLAYCKYLSRLPLGLSFITFQEISLLVDTYRGDRLDIYKDLISKKFFRHSVNVTLFVAFFPKLVAGPIVKAHDFLPQIGNKYLKDVHDISRILQSLCLRL